MQELTPQQEWTLAIYIGTGIFFALFVGKMVWEWLVGPLVGSIGYLILGIIALLIITAAM